MDGGVRWAFYGRVSTEDNQDPTLSLPRQLANCEVAAPASAARSSPTSTTSRAAPPATKSGELVTSRARTVREHGKAIELESELPVPGRLQPFSFDASALKEAIDMILGAYPSEPAEMGEPPVGVEIDEPPRASVREVARPRVIAEDEARAASNGTDKTRTHDDGHQVSGGFRGLSRRDPAADRLEG
jgi:hypothetical protein